MWSIAGALAAVLVLGGTAIGATQFADNADAQGTWQVKTWETEPGRDGVQLNVNGIHEAPGRFFDDWVRRLPADCELGPFVQLGSDFGIPYRCPS